MPATQSSPNLGLALPSSASPDYQPGSDIQLLASAIIALEAGLFGITKYTAAGAISLANGTAVLKAGSAAAMTLAAPTAGLPSAGGNDGQRLTIVALDAYAYTVTTPSNAINGSKHIGTFAGAVGDSIELVAYNGVWYVVGTQNGVTLS